MVGGFAGCCLTKTLVFSQSDLQSKLVDIFPVEKEKYRLNVVLSDPTIKLVEGSDWVWLER